MPDRPNVLFLLADQLRAASLPVYGETQIATPNIDRLAAEGTTFTNALATCPLCTPYRAMLLTGRHPQTTGHWINFVRTRHDEISIADAFARAGYRTGWVGKWHLHTGSFPTIGGPDYVPEGRDRLGFQYWRGYNFHMDYFDGFVNLDHWRVEPWKGYETDGLNHYALEFMDGAANQPGNAQGEPFCLFVSPHQPHWTGGTFAPEDYYDRLPGDLSVPENVPAADRANVAEQYRHYLAMTLAVDDMLGGLLDHLDRRGRAENTLVVFTSDHGSQMGAQGEDPWAKMLPYEASIRVPMIARWPSAMPAGSTCDALVTPVDIFPSLCRLCGLSIPQTVEGHDLSDSWCNRDGALERDAVLTMNAAPPNPNYLGNGFDWRGVRTKQYSYARWLDGRTVLYDLGTDPRQTTSLADNPAAAPLRDRMEKTLQKLLAERHDEFPASEDYAPWFDPQRRIVRNAFGPLPDPEAEPDWSLLG